MINREATIRWKGYDPDDLSLKSNKKVWANCDICGCGRWIKKSQYCALCHDCSIHTDDYKKRHIETNNSDRIKNLRSINTTNQWSDPDSREKILGGINDAWNDEQRKRDLIERQLGEKSCWFGVFGKDHGHWKGGNGNRSYVLPINQCIKLNEKFPGWDAHHITPSIIIYIPEELHHHYYPHCLSTGLNMEEINMISLQFIYGCYHDENPG